MREAYRDDKTPEIDLTRPIDLKLENPKISWTIKGNEIIIKALKPAKYVYLEIEEYQGKLSTNYMDLSAGEEMKISFEGKITKPIITVMSLYDVISRYK
jgi:beta-mannosidase